MDAALDELVEKLASYHPEALSGLKQNFVGRHRRLGRTARTACSYQRRTCAVGIYATSTTQVFWVGKR